MTVLATGWTESKEEAANRWAWKRQRELRDSIVKAATPVMGAMLATISLIDEPHPADVATDLEAQYEKPQADEADWFTKTASERNDEYNIPLDLIERHNAKIKADIFTHDPNCKHEKAFPTYGGMMCRCGAKFDARNEFEQRLVNARNPKGNGYVNYQFR